MRSMSFTFCAAAVVAAMSLPTPVALADSAYEEHKESVSVSPSTVAPGGEVKLKLQVDVCGKGKSASGSSEAFVSEVRFAPAGDEGLHAEARIRSDAAPRSYDIQVTCKDGHGKATGTVTVVHRGEPSPIAPVQAGGGGTATLAQETGRGARQGGPGARHVATGLALAAAAAVAVALRSARRRRSALG